MVSRRAQRGSKSPKKSAPGGAAGEPQGPCNKPCTTRDLITGFWVGMAMAAVYMNAQRKPVIFARSLNKTNKSLSASSTLSLKHAMTEIATTASDTTAPRATFTAMATDTKTLGQGRIPNTIDHNPWRLTRASTERDFLAIARQAGTDKVWGANNDAECQANPSPTTCGDATKIANPKCRRAGHYYHTLYNRWLGPYSADDTEAFQFLEIGFFQGKGYDAYKEFLPKAETHSIEIACIEPGPREEGKWPWGNFPEVNPKYKEYLATNQLHCGDGSDYDYLHQVWTTIMKRPDAPPLKVVIDDAAHISDHMAMTLFFWFPRIEPGGVLIVEDIQPMSEANQFRTHLVPQVLKDLHHCGDPRDQDKACFPTIWPLLQSVHCELHICVFERNHQPAVEYGKEQSIPPIHALNAEECLLRS